MKTYKRKLGDFGEELTRKYLEEEGYQILARNFAKPYGEIDIVAGKEDLVAFVEVKTRKNDAFGPPAAAVTFKKQERIKKAARAYIEENDLYDLLIRFDVSEVLTESKEIRYIENAF